MQSLGRRWPAVPALVVLALLAAPAAARADFMLTLEESGFAPLTLTDTNNTGMIFFPGGTGQFGDFQFGTGGEATALPQTSNPPGGVGVVIGTFHARNAALDTATLTLTVSYTGLTSPGGPGSLMTLTTDLGGDFSPALQGDALTVEGFADNGHTTKTLSGRGGNGFPVSDTFVRTGSTYSLVAKVSLTLPFSGEVEFLGSTTTLAVATVPEPGSLALGAAGSLLVGLGCWRPRRRRP